MNRVTLRAGSGTVLTATDPETGSVVKVARPALKVVAVSVGSSSEGPALLEARVQGGRIISLSSPSGVNLARVLAGASAPQQPPSA